MKNDYDGCFATFSTSRPMIRRTRPNAQVSVDVVTSGGISIESWDELLLLRFKTSQPLHRRKLWTVGGVVFCHFDGRSVGSQNG
jgi:hypothetical protein